MSRNALVRKSIFDEFSQVLHGIDASQIRPLGDRVLVMDDHPEPGQVGSIIVPESARGKDKYREGVVVAVGPGDKVRERLAGNKRMTSDGRPELKYGDVKVCSCGHTADFHYVGTGDCRHSGQAPQRCECRKFDPRIPMECKVGDRVLYRQRDDERFYIGDKTFFLVHCEQAIMGILTTKAENTN